MDSIFIFGLMLVLFGPKKLPEIARQAGKLMMEFRRASNEFKMQMEDELRAAEQAERQKKLEAETQAAVELAASALPLAPAQTADPGDTPELSIMPPSEGETVAATPPNRYRVDAEAEFSEAAYADASSSAPLTQEDTFRAAAYEAPVENNGAQLEIFADGPAPAETSAQLETPEPVAEKLQSPEDFTHNAPMAESDQAPIHHG